jgi:NTE family protein
MKYAYVFPGGGMKSAFSVGVVNNLVIRRGYMPSLITGTSGGALVGALSAMNKYKLLNRLYAEVGRTNGASITKTYLAELRDGSVYPNVDNIKEILTKGINFGDKVGLITKKGQNKFIKKVIENGKSIDKLMDNSPLRDLLLTHVRKADFICDFHFTLVSLYDGSLYTLNQNSFASDSDLALAILASSSMPGIWAPVPQIQLADGSIILDAVDGGLRSSSPLPQAFANLTHDDDWTVITPDNNSIKQMVNESKKNLIVQAMSSVEIMLNEGLQRDLKMSKKINDWALKYPEWAKAENIKYAKLIHMEVPLGPNGESLLGRTLDARAEWIEKRINLGYAEVEKYFKAA